MYKAVSSHQITFDDFNQSCGMQLDKGNGWCRLGDAFDWSGSEALYAKMFPSLKGHPAFPFRMAQGTLVANLFGMPLPCGGFFIVYFLDGPEDTQEWHFCEFPDCGEEVV